MRLCGFLGLKLLMEGIRAFLPIRTVFILSPKDDSLEE